MTCERLGLTFGETGTGQGIGSYGHNPATIQ